MEDRITKINQYAIFGVIALAILIPWQYEHSIIPISFAVYIWVVYEWLILVVWQSKLYVMNGQHDSKTARFSLVSKFEFYSILLTICFLTFTLMGYSDIKDERRLWVVLLISLLCIISQLFIAIHSYRKKINGSVFLGEEGLCLLQRWPMAILYHEIESISKKGLVNIIFQMKSGKEIPLALEFVSDEEKAQFMEALTAKVAVAQS